MDLALGEPIAAWNCWLQSEKAMRAAGSLADELAEADALAAELEVVAGAAGRLGELQAAPASRATPTASADSRVARRVGTP
jgi:hypothetical protein